MPHSDIDARALAVRHFNRFYTRQIGILDDGQLDSEFSLAELRVLYELDHGDRPAAADLADTLGIDPGYMSRIVARLARLGLVVKMPSPTDARRKRIALTSAGRNTFASLDRASQRQVTALIAPLGADQQVRLIAAMKTIERLLAPDSAGEAYLLRPPHTGDLAWMVHRQAVLYAREYGWDNSFEALTAEIVSTFISSFDPGRECCWIAERDARIVGGVFVARVSDEEAKLRMLYVEEEARGLGLGRRLVDECIRFARHAGYRRMSLWTNDVLTAARHIYTTTGFHLVRREDHHSFGKDLVGEFWEREL